MPVIVPEGGFDRELICAYLRVSRDSNHLSKFKADDKNPFLMAGQGYKIYDLLIKMLKDEVINYKNLRFCDVDEKSISVHGRRYRREVTQSKYKDTSTNEIHEAVLGPVDVFLNLTNHPVTIRRKGSRLEQVSSHIINSNLIKIYAGKLYIIEFYYFFNSPDIRNYLEVKINQYKNANKSLHRIYGDAFKFLEYMHHNLGNVNRSSFVNLDEPASEAPIVLVYITLVIDEWFELAKQNADRDSIYGIYIPHKDVIVQS